jgi:hypothetical protein
MKPHDQDIAVRQYVPSPSERVRRTDGFAALTLVGMRASFFQTGAG